MSDSYNQQLLPEAHHSCRLPRRRQCPDPAPAWRTPHSWDTLHTPCLQCISSNMKQFGGVQYGFQQCKADEVLLTRAQALLMLLRCFDQHFETNMRFRNASTTKERTVDVHAADAEWLLLQRGAPRAQVHACNCHTMLLDQHETVGQGGSWCTGGTQAQPQTERQQQGLVVHYDVQYEGAPHRSVPLALLGSVSRNTAHCTTPTASLRSFIAAASSPQALKQLLGALCVRMMHGL